MPKEDRKSSREIRPPSPVPASPVLLGQKPSEADFGRKRRNSCHSAVFGEAGNGTVTGIPELARQEGFEPPALSLGVAVIRCSSVAVKRGKPLILLDFAVVTLLVMYGFFCLFSSLFVVAISKQLAEGVKRRQMNRCQLHSYLLNFISVNMK